MTEASCSFEVHLSLQTEVRVYIDAPDQEAAEKAAEASIRMGDNPYNATMYQTIVSCEVLETKKQ